MSLQIVCCDLEKSNPCSDCDERITILEKFNLGKYDNLHDAVISAHATSNNQEKRIMSVIKMKSYFVAGDEWSNAVYNTREGLK